LAILLLNVQKADTKFVTKIIMKISIGLAASLAVFGFIGQAKANLEPYTGSGPITFSPTSIISANGGNVSVTYEGSSAGDLDLLFQGPAAGPPSTAATIFYNNTISPDTQTPVGTTIPLGSFGVGVELEFAIYNVATKETFYSGDPSRNKDKDVHAYVIQDYMSNQYLTYVGFEDLSPTDSSDWDYNDLAFVVDSEPADLIRPLPDASATLPLFGISLAGLAAFARRLKK
jgi:hypothetical protein